jgi:hypothetical protein
MSKFGGKAKGYKKFGASFTVKNDRLRVFLRWLCYCLVLLLFYMVMASGFFRNWQPVLIIPLAIAVAMRERELSASVFGTVCGLVLDLAGERLFGFSGVWLLPGCLASALLVSHLIKVNLINFLWLNAAVCFIMALTDYFFRYALFAPDNASFVLANFIIPAHLSAVIISPLIYLPVKFISAKFSVEERIKLYAHSSSDDDEDYR